MHKNEMAASQVKRMGGNTRNLPLFATRPENVDDVFALRNDFLFGEYRGGNKGLFVLLSRTQAGPGRTVKQGQEEISRNHIQTFISPSVL